MGNTFSINSNQTKMLHVTCSLIWYKRLRVGVVQFRSWCTCTQAVSFRGLSLVSRVATSIAVAASQRLSLSEAVVVYFAATLDCRGEDSLSLADVDDEPATPPAPTPVSVRRSGRVRRAPAWHKDYIM
ncbi:uncharacterized protein [Argopecten irradians]|uniref:uncharacterized protein isoform X1 n=1 Tax=Argopecten irradians TaxID=31199 RepID=UPI00371F0A65